MDILLSKLEEKLNQQTLAITASVTKSVMEALDEKIKTLTEENHVLKTKVTNLEQKLTNIDNEKRKNNLIFFGIEENGKTECELVDYIKELIIDAGVQINSQEINNVYRIGRPTNNKNRPVVVSFTTLWKKHTIMKNKAGLPTGTYIKEDFSKEILEQRKQLQSLVDEERKKGKIAFLKYNKIIIKTPSQQDKNRDKRKREESVSPKLATQKKSNKQQPITKEILKPGILNYIERGRSSSLSENPKN